ncbi:MAG TPA: hypothetical protein EYP61_03950 [Candidatus Latescibacteria bacterium]|nr:hypothetical protein [Candidatus Latescibacterota bacterium]
MRKAGIFVLLLCSSGFAQPLIREPLSPGGPGVLMGALEPALRKWYVPQELYYMYGWEQWRYSNYARDLYKRYVDINLQGNRYYDIFGNYVTRGWQIFDWSQEQPRDFGSSIFKSPKYASWFDNLLISSAHKGQYYTALTVGDEIRTTLTPLTFSKPTFNGIQLDFLSDKYSATVIASRISNPGTPRMKDISPPETMSDFTNLVGLRGTVQLGRFVTVGATYVDAFVGRSLDDWAENSLKGRLSSGQNAGKVRKITIRLSDDSPEDGEAGAALFSEQIFIDGRPADIHPVIKGGEFVKGHYEANGKNQMLLVYDISGWSYVDETGTVRDVNWFKRVSFALVLANDYKVEITSNLQVDATGQEIFLPVTRAPGNVKDATNLRVVRFDYGLPTANEIYGVTLEVSDLYGFWLRAEYDVNRRHRRFPNQNPEITEHTLATDRSVAGYLTLAKLAYPWYAYLEVFHLDYDYSTTSYIVDMNGRIFYDDAQRYWFEFVDDNDDQDRYPDWDRCSANQRAGNDYELQNGIFPGLDENNDFVSDFNQNQNYQPDYEEPFLRYSVDPPEFLFGMDMNHNTIIDRFENDEEPDYPYRRDRRGYNAYVGVEVLPRMKLTLGRMEERTLSRKEKSEATYVLLTYEPSFPGVGDLRVFENLVRVRDNIPDNLVQWEQLPNTKGAMVPFEDPLVCRNTLVNTFYVDFKYTGKEGLNIINKFKYQIYHQMERTSGIRKDSRLVGLINKADYRFVLPGRVVFWPKFKSMYLWRQPFKTGELERKELWEILSLNLAYPVFERGSLEFGLEYTRFYNLLKRPAVPPPGYVEDFQGLVLAAQFSNQVDFMGYRLVSKVGIRQQTRYFRKTTRTGNVIFVRIYAGVE